MRDHEVIQLTLWRLREFLREPEALFWIFAFPLLLAIALGLAFKNQGEEIIRIGVVSNDGDLAIFETLSDAPALEPVAGDYESLYQELRTGRLVLLVTPGDPVTYTYDSTRAEAHMARLRTDDALQSAAGRTNPARVRDALIAERGSRYIDFLIPGLLGLNIMGTGMWGVGFGIVKDRMNKLLKRLLASPMRRRHYLLAHMLSRMSFLIIEVTGILAFGALVFDVPIRGSLLLIAVISILGALAFAGLGLLVGSRQKTVEGVSGLMNLIMVPMWIGSGVFFAYTNFPEAIHPFLRMLPLTALNDSLRAVMLEGVGLAAIAVPLAIMAGWTVISFGLALKLFRWE
ncbi:MAG: ABC transporter permease [Rhodothermales bacterium]|nr:ABC transporter permease [Rhodothermales bacterium]MBO6781500.1 ABC transporter permease [Rhodothermales bacterium]